MKKKKTLKIYEPYFEPKGHLYHTPDGMILDSVTTILKNALNMYQYGDNSRAIRGSAIHRMIELYDENNLDINSLSDDLKNMLEVYKKAKKELNFTSIQSEIRRYHPDYLFAGTIDKIVLLNNEYWLIDIKTGSKEIWHKWQTAAYAKLLEKEIPIKNRGCLYLTTDAWELEPHTYNMDFPEFLSLFTAYKIAKKYGYKK